MSQSRAMSLIESLTNVAVGLGLAFAANAALLPAIGCAISARENAALTAAMTALSIARSYALRRGFERLRARGGREGT
jgi:hypothetical protein